MYLTFCSYVWKVFLFSVKKTFKKLGYIKLLSFLSFNFFYALASNECIDIIPIKSSWEMARKITSKTAFLSKKLILYTNPFDGKRND